MNQLPPRLPIKKFLSSASATKLAPGVVGRSSLVMISLCSIFGIISYSMNDNFLHDLFELIVGIIIIIAVMFWFISAKRYAKENPELALMEGAQLVMARQFQYQTANPEVLINSGEERSDGHVFTSSTLNEEDKDV